ncbi:S8 family serine peptidase [Ideonella sp. A 288]|uniref:S8 family serine peptidase n=1 Tax=Ideonella sp. A 288 TaxID=1962181 RepID=UPI0013034191|nr:S8 family serine peptidase [Ideonella sp. A 288]
MKTIHHLSLVAAAATLALLPLGTLSAAEARPVQAREFVQGELLVKFKSRVPAAERASRHARDGHRRLREFRNVGIDHVALAAGESMDAALQRYRANPDVEFAEPNFVLRAQATPLDPGFPQLWGLNNTGQAFGTPGADIKAPLAWNTTTGSAGVVVMMIDSGFDHTHPDLAANAWVNAAEANGVAGIDDDGNGFVDDVHGIDVSNGDGDPMDDNGHGTHVAGVIGAVGNNNLGVVGVNWTVRLAACKTLNALGESSVAGAIACLEYTRALKNAGVNVVAANMSWGGPGGFSQGLRDAISAQQDILFIASAGNLALNNDTNAFYPASYDLPNVIAVAATDRNDALPAFSSYGRRSVHLGAPGVDVLSTFPGAQYISATGTSSSAAYVTGVAALLKAQDPTRDWRAIKNLILSGASPVTSLTGKTISGRRLDAANAVNCSNRPLLSAVKVPSNFAAGTPVTLSALSINCGASVGPVTVATSNGVTVALRDDGIAPDQAAGDGVFAGTWTPTAGVTFIDYTSAAGTERVAFPDLAVPTFTGPASVPRGQPFTVVATVANLGAAAAAASSLSVYLSTDAVFSTTDTLIGSVAVPAIAAGTQQPVSIGLTIPASMPAATYRLFAVADAGNVVAESNEDNNVGPARAIAVTAAPVDLTVSAVSGPLRGTRGQAITLKGTVKNLGTAAAGASTLRLVLSTDASITTADTTLVNVPIGALAAGASQAFTATAVIPAGLVARTYTLGAIADVGNVVAETNEANNARAGNTIAVR